MHSIFTYKTAKHILTLCIIVVIFTSCVGNRKGHEASFSTKICILFFNDLHGHLRPFKIRNGHAIQEAGGIARLSAAIKKIRLENDSVNTRTLVFVAGDILQGTPMSSVFRGQADIECLNAMGVDAVTVGNHEFDFGLDNFLVLKKYASFPFLSANILERKHNRPLCAPYYKHHLGGDLYISVIGTTTDELLTTTTPSHVAALKLKDAMVSVKQAYEDVKHLGPVLLLSHSKHRIDRAIAAAVPDLAAIIGGHDHILLSPYDRVGRVPIFQAFEKGRYLGRIDFEIDSWSKKARLINHGYIPITVDITPDQHVAAIVAKYSARLGQKFNEIIGVSQTFLDGERGRIRYEETNLGNLITGIMQKHTGADIALLNAGAIRNSIAKGPITLEDVFKALPYANRLVVMTLRGAEIERVLKRSVSGMREDEDGGFLQVAGLYIEIQGHQVKHIRVGQKRVSLDLSAAYRVVLPDFLAAGGDGYDVFKTKPKMNTGLILRDLVVDVIRKRGSISANTEGRIQRTYGQR